VNIVQAGKAMVNSSLSLLLFLLAISIPGGTRPLFFLLEVFPNITLPVVQTDEPEWNRLSALAAGIVG
jgi:hypothetical protein